MSTTARAGHPGVPHPFRVRRRDPRSSSADRRSTGRCSTPSIPLHQSRVSMARESDVLCGHDWVLGGATGNGDYPPRSWSESRPADVSCRIHDDVVIAREPPARVESQNGYALAVPPVRPDGEMVGVRPQAGALPRSYLPAMDYQPAPRVDRAVHSWRREPTF